MKRGGLDMYNDQSSDEILCDTSSGSSGPVHSPEVSLSPSPEVLVSTPPPDLDLSTAVADALQTQHAVTLARELAILTEVSSPLLESLQQIVDLASWKTNLVSTSSLDDADLEQRMQVILDEIQNCMLPMPFDLHGLGYDEISKSLFEIHRTACHLLLYGIQAGLCSSSATIAELVKEVQTQVDLVSFLPNVPPHQYLFAACIAKSFATDNDTFFMNSFIASVNDQSIKTTAHHLLATALTRASM